MNYTLQYTDVSETDIKLFLTYGNVAHEVVETLFTAEREGTPLEDFVLSQYEQAYRRALVKKGALLLLPEHHLDRERLRYISPDAVVVLVDDHFEILINEYQYPKFTISSFYQDMAKTVEDAETKKYLKEKIAQAQNIAGSIEQRNSTLSKVLNVLVEKQQDFFLKGPGNKRPMRLIDIAEAADLHESTISRTLRSKYLQCHWGVFPLNYFLTSVAATNKQSGEEQTPEYIKSKMQEVIDNEDKKKPLSDEAISKCLKEMEIPISRRTVNKYRQEMGIPDKSGRKEWGD